MQYTIKERSRPEFVEYYEYRLLDTMKALNQIPLGDTHRLGEDSFEDDDEINFDELRDLIDEDGSNETSESEIDLDEICALIDGKYSYYITYMFSSE